eukprot:scaffold38577_cov77-Cyclotella_meneghiniana.AAC.4
MTEVADQIYIEYCKLDDRKNAAREVFRKLLLATGTGICIQAATKRDPTKQYYIANCSPFIIMIQTMEVRDKYNGAYDENIKVEIEAPLNDIVSCARETVRFFHRRNTCNCLKELYYILKETTKRTAACWTCQTIVDIRQLSRCEGCQIANYCSYECAAAHWPYHKTQCKNRRKYLENQKESMQNAESSGKKRQI